MTPKLRVIVISVLLSGISYAAEDRPKAAPSTEKEIAAVIERAKADPNILWDLKDAPIDKTFGPLSDLWSEGRGSLEQRLNARKVSEEDERRWLALQKQMRKDPDTAERLSPVALEVLLSNPNLEAYATERLQIINNYLTDAHAGKNPRPIMFNASGEAGQLLRAAVRLPGDAAFRIVGPYLSVPDYPDLPRGDIRSRAPAKTAQKAVALLAKERLGIDLGDDVEATRKWWAENKHRFEVEPKQN